ncbi:MAG: FHA domain-containing protein [Thermoguttaceae bacterium]|jgi:pSer/pThr/pTyr-binding forkhead associated (FHA) protein
MLGVLEPYRGGDDIPLRKPEVVIGRSEKNDVVLRFSDVSGTHCRLVLSRGYWYAEDLGSTNGTRVNGLRTQDHRVDPGDRVSIAKHDFILRYDPVKNGAEGETPPDFLDDDVFNKSLLERAGISKKIQSAPKTWEVKRQKGATLEELESGAGADYSHLTLDDIEFDN